MLYQSAQNNSIEGDVISLYTMILYNYFRYKEWNGMILVLT